MDPYIKDQLVNRLHNEKLKQTSERNNNEYRSRLDSSRKSNYSRDSS